MKKFEKGIFVLLLFFAIATSSKAQIYMNVSGITGDVTTPAAYANDIAVSSYQGGVGRGISIGSSGAATSPPSVSDITISMAVGSASLPLLNTLLNTSSPIPTVDFYFVNASCSCPYYRVHLVNAYVSGYSESSGGDTPTISLSISFTKIAWAYYKPNSTTVSYSTGYDLVKQTAYSYAF